MEYNGIKLTEAKGENYTLGPTPKEMIVWDNDNGVPRKRGVLGFYNGEWVAARAGGGITHWYHAAELPKVPTLAEHLHGINKSTGYYPYLVVRPGRAIADAEEQWSIVVREDELLCYMSPLSNPAHTFVVLPGCSDATKDMLQRLGECKDTNHPHASVEFYAG